jgi:serine/threonine protein phosphatase PrpC
MATRYQYAQARAWARESSQDSCKVFERGELLVVVVADGGGGMRGGGAASRSLVAVVEAAVNDARFVLEDEAAWLALFRQTDAGLAANGAGETTGVVVVLGPRGIVGVSTGNSQAWLVSPAEIDDLTASQHTGDRLGSHRATSATFQRPKPPSDCLLVVASDGLFTFAGRGVIAALVRTRPLDLAAQNLVELVRLRSGKVPEDVSVVLVGSAPAPLPPS